MDVDAGPQSLFIVVSQYGDTPYATSIIRLETPLPNHELASSIVKQEIPTDFSAHIPHLPTFERWEISWGISASSTGDLYMLPDWPSYSPENVGSFPGLIFNLSTKKCKIIKPPLAPKYFGYVVTMGDYIYFTTQPRNSSPHFERYHTLSQSWEELKPPPQSWEELKPPPHYDDDELPFRQSFTTGLISGTAVLDDTILFNVTDNIILAYNVGKNQWYIVKVLNNNCYNILGEAVVLNKSIYTFGSDASGRELVVTLTLKCQETPGNLEFTCDQNKEYELPAGMFEIESDQNRDASWLDRRLVHLGKDNFCVVQSYSCIVEDTQYIRITYIELSEKKSIVTNICLHKFKCGDNFMIEHCFSMPKCKTTALKEATRINPKHEAEIIFLPPELLMQCPSRRKSIFELGPETSEIQSSLKSHHADTSPETITTLETPDETQEDVPKKSYESVIAAKSNVPCKASTISAESSGYAKPSSATKASTLGYGAASGPDEEGYFICVRNLPNDFNFVQLDEGLRKFGPIKTLWFDFSHKSELVANVEFESTTSKQNAIKESSIRIGGRSVAIEKRI